VVFDEHLCGIRWTLTLAIGGARVLVHAQDAESARAVLGSAEPDARFDAAAAESPPLECPVCRSEETVSTRPGLVWLLLSFSFLEPFPHASLHLSCRTCGHRWRPSEPWHPLESPAELESAEQAVAVGSGFAPPVGTLAACIVLGMGAYYALQWTIW
jgi:hypothetical protein